MKKDERTDNVQDKVTGRRPVRERLDKRLAQEGYGTRSEIRKAVRAGRVSVNGHTEKDPGRQITPDGMAMVMTDVLESGMLRTFFGMTDLNRTPKKWEREMRKYEAWFARHGKDYPVNWNVSFDESRHKEGSFYYFTRCPICEFCEREGIAELMPALCATDEVMFRLQHGKLHRKHTIAKGEPICDYWVVGDKAEDPK